MKDRKLACMLDCSRNAVFHPEQVKRFADYLAKMGYNQLLLYTEDTYEIDDEPYFGYLRGKYTQAELKDIDKYCRAKGIELVPCIQTLAHLGAITRWKKYYEFTDVDDILLVDDERTYELIEKMFQSISKTFSSRLIHVGLDEAHNIGRGKYLDAQGYEKSFTLFMRHLLRVYEIANKYGFQIKIWSDAFTKFVEGNIDNKELLEQTFSNLPKDIDFCFWEYYSKDVAKYDRRISFHKQYCGKTTFAGGAICWLGYVQMIQKSLEIADVAIESLLKNDIQDVMVTMWGDGGAQCSFYSVLPVLLYYAEKLKGNNDLADIKKKFFDMCVVEWDTFLLLDLPNKVGDQSNLSILPPNPSLYMLYNDYFAGSFDCMVADGDGEPYEQYAKELQAFSNLEEFGYIFDVLSKLCSVLAKKYELGVKTRRAYLAKDKSTLR